MASHDTGVPTSSYVGQNTTVDRTEYQMGGSGLNIQQSSNFKKNTITQIEDLIMGHHGTSLDKNMSLIALV